MIVVITTNVKPSRYRPYWGVCDVALLDLEVVIQCDVRVSDTLTCGVFLKKWASPQMTDPCSKLQSLVDVVRTIEVSLVPDDGTWSAPTRDFDDDGFAVRVV